MRALFSGIFSNALKHSTNTGNESGHWSNSRNLYVKTIGKCYGCSVRQKAREKKIIIHQIPTRIL